jgi:aryl-alcohol dehydrogenase-like predicted oxidoreductase
MTKTELSTLSKVGFGSYRISSDNPIHEDALNLYFNLGGNLVDTAHSYTKGSSEELIGKVLQNMKDKEIFLVSKVGYVSSTELQGLEFLARQDSIDLGGNYSYCIHPSFIKKALQESLSRTKLKSIGAYLLHNPEYLLFNNIPENIFYSRIEASLRFLEQKAQDGTIQYYGISSNTLPLNPSNNKNVINLDKILEIAYKISPFNHFKIIQFPYNLIESSANQGIYFQNKNLFEYAKQKKITTLVNRPFNANTENGTIRLANNNSRLSQEQYNTGSLLITGIINTLKENFPEKDIVGNEILSFISTNWANINHIQSVHYYFEGKITPYISSLYGDDIPKSLKEELNALLSLCEVASKQNMNTIATAIKEKMETLSVTHTSPCLPLQSLLCEKYLNDGADHVLIGMRTPDYVHDFKKFFSHA